MPWTTSSLVGGAHGLPDTPEADPRAHADGADVAACGSALPFRVTTAISSISAGGLDEAEAAHDVHLRAVLDVGAPGVPVPFREASRRPAAASGRTT